MSHAPALSENPITERRKPIAISPKETAPNKRSSRNFLEFFIHGFKLLDILSTQHHSKDFIESRAEFIAVRVRFMALFYAFAVPLWIPVDYLLLRPEHFSAMIIPKLLLTAFLLPLGLLTLRKLTSNQIHIIFTLTILAAGAFYFASMQILNQGDTEPLLAGYSFMPCMFVSMLGIVPLTLTWGFALTAMITVIYLGLKASLGQLMTLDTANMLWILIILSAISLWVQSSQLLMLLRLYREATRDPLTGLVNRRVLMKRLSTEMDHNRNTGSPFCVMIFDLDRFKRINDNHGHLIGDLVLKTTADILQKGVREQDIVARFGGEEFVAVLTGCKYETAIEVAERIRASCLDATLSTSDGEPITFSTSVGVTEYETGETIETTLNRVDESLYMAKEQGRNRVVHNQSTGFSRK